MDALFERLFVRHRHHYWLWTWIVLIPTFVLVLIVPAIVGVAMTADIATGSLVALLLLTLPTAVLGSIGSWVVTWPGLGRPITQWLRGAPVDPAWVWRLAERGPVVTNAVGGSLAALLSLAGFALLAREHITDLPLSSFAVLVLIGIPPLTGLQVHGTRLATRPILREISQQHPAAVPTSKGPGGVRVSIVTGTASITLYGLLLGAAVATQIPDDQSARVLILGGLALVAMVWSSLVFLTMVGFPVLRPLEDLTLGAQRVAAGELGERVPVTSRDELGELCTAFNVMQAGLRDRERLHAAFGSYVDPSLAERLLAQDDSLFDGEEVDVTVMFVDVRNFTSWAEGVTPAQAVARLNELFSVVVPILVEHGGHANKYLGDGVLGVFGVPVAQDNHADAAVGAALDIQRRVADHFEGQLGLGIGINSGPAIAGTIGGGGKLEFTLIGDVVNVASRVEELTKQTDDAILATSATIEALTRPVTTTPRGQYAVRGKQERVQLLAVTA